MIFYLFLISIFIIAILMFIYVYNFTKKFNIKVSNKKLNIFINSIPSIIFIIYFILDYVNAFVVLIHLLAFSIIFNLLFRIIKKIRKKEFKYYYSGLLTVVVTIIYLSFGYYNAHHVVETDYIVYTNKISGEYKVAQVSDSHVGATMDGDEFINYMKEINLTNPDVIVVTGDFVDDDTSLIDMIKACEGLGLLNAPVYFVYGNHDKGYFGYRNFTDKELRSELAKNNVIILEDEVVRLTDNIYLIGRQDYNILDRLSMEELLKDISEEDYTIVLDHQPTDYENELGADLVLSGHTHGGQLFPLGQLSVLAGINDSYEGMKVIDNTTFIVNTGLGDWAMKYKTFTRSEYTIITIKGE